MLAATSVAALYERRVEFLHSRVWGTGAQAKVPASQVAQPLLAVRAEDFAL